VKNRKRLTSVLLSVSLMLPVLAACTSGNVPEPSGGNTDPSKSPTTEIKEGAETTETKYSELKIRMLGSLPTGNKAAVEDVLTPIWREKTKVIPEIINVPTGQDNPQWFQMQTVANSLPEILATNGTFDNPQVFELLKKNRVLRTITLDQMKENMPLLAKRAEKYGVTLEQIYQDNVSADGNLYYIPGQFNLSSTPYVRSSRLGDENIGVVPYVQYIRDDILKKIFPNAKTEAELLALYQQNGKLTYEDINDIPITSLQDFHDALSRIKQLNLKQGERPVIAASPSANSDVTSLMWSQLTMSGFWWQYGSFAWKEDQLVYVQGTPEWKEYIRWYNQAYNEDLLDKEHFIQKDDQRNAKVINGEYATFQGWGPVNDARKLSKEEGRGYGYRMIPMFADMPLENSKQTMQYYGANLKGDFGGIGLTTSLKDENIPQVLHWIDWNMSEEADQLRAWGPEGKFYEGNLSERRFKPEYKELENFLVRGNKGEKDGIYYGLYDSPFRNNDLSGWNHETFGIRSFQYPEQAYYVYPSDKSEDINLDNVVNQAIRKHYKDKLTFYRKDVHEDFSYLDPDGKWGELSKTNAWDSEAGKTSIVKAIVGKPADFDKNYAIYEKSFSPEYTQAVQAMAENWKQIYHQYVKPAIEQGQK